MTKQEYQTNCSRIRRQIKNVLEEQFVDIVFEDFDEALRDGADDYVFNHVKVITRQYILREHLVELAWYGFKLRSVSGAEIKGAITPGVALWFNAYQFVLEH